MEFLQDPDPPSPFFVLAGYSGTGKTFCLREIIAKTTGSHLRCAYTATTNKAAKVVKAVTGSASTIYSLLGLRIDKSGELKEIVPGKPPEELSDLDVIYLDESSMVNKALWAEILKAAERYHLKFVLMGDNAQLPPINEGGSPIWGLPLNAQLTKVERHDNQILKLVTEIRSVIFSPSPCITIRNNNDGLEGVFKMSKNDFREGIYRAAERGDFADGTVSKIIAWRNVRVSEYNTLVRYALYGAEAQDIMFMPGERVVAAGPCERGDQMLLHTDEEAIVQYAKNCRHPFEPKYTAIELKSISENGQIVRLLVVHPASRMQWELDCQNLANAARANSRLWKSFWNLKDLFHDIRYAYAITAHRSQGSTYENAWVDYQDILLNRERTEAFQCLYVACSRPTTCLYLA